MCQYSGYRPQDVFSMFQDYIRKLSAFDGSNKESVFKKPKINKNFRDFSGLQGTSVEENCELRTDYVVQSPLDQFLCLLLGILKQGEDLVLFHSGLEGVNNSVVDRTGLCGEKFIGIHRLLYELLQSYACLENFEGYVYKHDSCGVQSLLYYLNSNCLGESASVSIDDSFLNIELATTLSKLLERPNCVLKTLYIEASSIFEVDQERLQKLQNCHMMIIATLSKCVSMTSLTVRGLNGEEAHELYKSLSVNKVLENLVISIHGPLYDDHAMALSAVVKENYGLKNFTLEFKGIRSKGAACLGAMLAENSSLERLSLKCLALNEIRMGHIIWPLMTNMDGEPHVNLSLKHLHFDFIGECPPGGAVIISRLLCSNKTLTHFSIKFEDWDQGAACKILDSLKKNRNLQVLNLLGLSTLGNDSRVAACLEAMLADNSTLEELKVGMYQSSKFGLKHLLRPLIKNEDGGPRVNMSLKRLHILSCNFNHNWEAVESISKMLQTNKTLSHFSMVDAHVGPSDACKILDSLKVNKALRVVNLQGQSSFRFNFEVAASLEAMLVENSTLEELEVDMRMLDELCLEHLLRPLMVNKDGEPHINTSLRRLHILNYNYNQGNCIGTKHIAQMLRSNKTLSHFSMVNASLNTCDVCEILDSLKINKALQVLNLDKCIGLDDPRAKVAFMDLLVNYNFTLHTIIMHGRDWDVEAFMKLELEHDTLMAEGRLWSLVGGILESPATHNVPNDLTLQRDEGSTFEGCESSMKAFEEHGDLIVGHRSELEEILDDVKSNIAKANLAFGLRNSKLEMESQQSLQELKALLVSTMKSTHFLLRRNLNMAQFLQERYSKWDSSAKIYPSKLTGEEKDEFREGCIVAALFPITFLYHLKARLLQGSNLGGILHIFKEVASFVVQRMKSLQDSRSQTFEFIDYLDFQASHGDHHIHSLKETIALSQTSSTKIGIGEELQAKNFTQYYGIVQDHLTGVYCFNSVKPVDLNNPNIDKSVGVIGVKVTSTKIQVEIMWEDDSYYSGTLEDFSYEHKNHDNNQCAFEAFGHLKGAHFLRTCGLKCSPLLVIALAMAIGKKGLTLTWNNGKGHIQTNSPLPVQLKELEGPEELEEWECQILYGGDISQLGEAIEWGMNEVDQNYTSSSRNNQCQEFILEYDPNQTFSIFDDTSIDTWSSDEPIDTSNDTSNIVDSNVLASQFNAGAQSKMKVSVAFKVLGSGGDIGFEIQNSKGKKIEDQSFKKMQDLHWREEGGYVFVGNLDAKHQFLEERLFQGSLSAEHDVNYLVVYDNYKSSHVSIYWVKERNDISRLELKWITDIFIKGGLERIKKIFEGLKGETLEVTRSYTNFYENSFQQQQSKGLMKWFKNRRSNKGNCKDNVLQMVSSLDSSPHPKFSNDDWKHIVGLQPCEPTKFWLMASYMQAISYSRTRYSSGLLLSTHTSEQYGLKCGSVRRNLRRDASKFVHDFEAVKSCAKFTKPPLSLSSKWHDMFHWGGFKETLV